MAETNPQPEKKDNVADQEFDFDAEFSLLDIGVTTSLLQAGGLRSSVIAFHEDRRMDAMTLEWESDQSPDVALEDARRHLRNTNPVAYAFVALANRTNDTITYFQPKDHRPGASDYLTIQMYAANGMMRSVAYPIRKQGQTLSFGQPIATDSDNTPWEPIGDIWENPFCVNDLVRFRTGDRAVDPSSALWQMIVDLTRLRIQEDQHNSEEYLRFLNDLRDSIFVVLSRSAGSSKKVLLKPRTYFNPLGILETDASRLRLVETSQETIEQVSATHQK